MTRQREQLSVLERPLAICRLEPGDPIPGWALSSPFLSVTKTADELSIVCDENAVPAGSRCERGFRALRVDGTLEFGLVGVLAGLTTPLAKAGVSVFALSTFDTDYLLVKQTDLCRARATLTAAGYPVSSAQESRPSSQ